MASGGNPLSEAQFIYHGLKKDKWPHITIQMVQGWLDEPSELDDHVGWEDFLKAFYYYYEWYWDLQNLK